AFTSRDHNFYPDETFRKQLILINNSRQTVTAHCAWSLALPKPISGAKHVHVETGQHLLLPLTFSLPPQIAPGNYELSATAKFSNGQVQEDAFSIGVLQRPVRVQTQARLALFDPKGETSKLLNSLGVACIPIDAAADLSNYDLLIVGKGALTPDSAGPN